MPLPFGDRQARSCPVASRLTTKGHTAQRRCPRSCSFDIALQPLGAGAGRTAHHRQMIRPCGSVVRKSRRPHTASDCSPSPRTHSSA